MIAGRWKPLILLAVKDGPARFSEIQRANPECSGQVLSRQLGELTADGVLGRECNEAMVSYKLTERGEQLSQIMELLESWGTEYLGWRSLEGPFVAK